MDGETTKTHQQQVVVQHDALAEHQITTSTIRTTSFGDHTVDNASLFHLYNCFKLSFLIKMALMKNAKALGYALTDEDVKRDEKSMEDARIQALEKWEQIRDRGFSYDVEGSSYLRSCKPI